MGELFHLLYHDLFPAVAGGFIVWGVVEWHAARLRRRHELAHRRYAARVRHHCHRRNGVKVSRGHEDKRR